MATSAIASPDQITSTAWLLWANSSQHELPLIREVDGAFSNLAFYPESDWPTFGFRPPEDLELHGAWRNQQGTLFVFLLGRGGGKSQVQAPLTLHVSGAAAAVEEVGRLVTALKTGLMKAERRDLQARVADERLSRERQAPALTSLVKLVGLFTVVVNAFSFYLRQLSPPSFPSESLKIAYSVLVTVVHFAAVVLLLILTVVGIAYAVRLAVLMLRRL